MMENVGGANSTSNPLANQASPEQPMGAGQGNPLARLAPAMGGQSQPMPAPTKAQTVAGIKRLSAVQAAMKELLADPDIGKANARPTLMDAASKLLGSKAISLSELMSELNTFPDDPVEQKQWAQRVYTQAQIAEAHLLDSHGAAIVAGKLPPDGGASYDAGNHDEHLQGMLKHYKRG